VLCILFLFRWERDQRLSSLILAFLAWTLALQFHALAIFLAPLFLFPGLIRRSPRHLVQGAVAFGAAALLFKVSSYLAASYYPQDEEHPEVPELAAPMRGLQELASSHPWFIAAAAIASALLLIPIAVRLLKYRDGHMWPPLLVGSALLAMSVLHYHVAAVLMFVGAVFWLRSPDIPKRWLYTGMALAALLAVSHLVILHASGLYAGRKLFGAVTGQPSVWPILRFLNYSPAAGAIFLLTSAVALARFAAVCLCRTTSLFSSWGYGHHCS
jgi:hypothetical protein